MSSIQNEFNDELLWTVLKTYMSQYKFITKHHIDSYNHFIKKDIPDILTNMSYVIHIHPYGNRIFRTLLEFENIRFTSPVETINNKDIIIYPQLARERNLSYESKIYATVIQKQHIIDIHQKTDEKKEISRKEIVIAHIPVMIYSDLCILNTEKYKRNDCKYDNGGYFIVNGGEKMCILQERLVYNRIFVLTKQEPNLIEYYAEVNSQNPTNKFKFSTLRIHLKKNNIITISLQLFKNVIHIPVVVILYLCGIEDDEEILNLILQDSNRELLSEYITPIFQYKTILNKKLEPIRPNQTSKNINNIYTDLKNYLNKEIFGQNQEIENSDKIFIQYQLKNVILSHLGTNLIKKGKYICYMINQLLLTKIGKLELSDRDSSFNKRVETTGSILEHVFNYSLNNMLEECKLTFRKRIGTSVESILNPPLAIEFLKVDSFNKEFKIALTRGEIKPLSKTGVFHVYKNVSYMDSIANSRMIRTPSIATSGTSSKLLKPRYLHNTQFGYKCPVESPEGKNIGLMTFMSNSCMVTHENKSNKDKLIELINNLIYPFNSVQHYDMFKYYRVFVDGDWIGFVVDPVNLQEKFIKLRRGGIIDYQFSINLNFNTMETHIQTDAGRLIRPLLIVDKQILLPPSYITSDKTWDNYKKSNYIEFLDVEESYTKMIALHYTYIDKNNFLQKNKKKYQPDEIVFRNVDNVIKKFTHCEIHPLALIGLSTSCLPLQNHNQAPKDTSSCKYIKQAITIYNPAFRERFDKQGFILHSPQIPIVGTKIHEITKLNDLPTGQNAIIAIAVYSGFNQDDSIIINKSAIERGFFNVTFYKSFESKLEKNTNIGKSDIFFKPNPDKVQNIKKANYNKLNSNGIINEETIVEPFDAIIGKLSPIENTSNDINKIYRDSSIILKLTEYGIVDKILTNITNSENEELCKVKIRQTRPAHIGDKFCYDNQTEILTNSGWKFFNKLNYSDKIATLTKTTNIFAYENPLEVFQYDYKGEMIQLLNRYCNYCVTPNHKLYIKNNNKFVLKTAGELFKKNKIFQTTSSFKGGEITRTNSRLYLHGLLLSIGLYRQHKIYIPIHKSEIIVNLCKKLSIQYKQCNHFIVLKSFTLNSIFPSWIWLMPGSKMKCFINGIFYNNYIFQTTNIKIVDLIQRAIIHAGYQSKFCITKQKYEIILIKDNIHYRTNSNSESKINYDDKVYCCTSSSGVICVRRGGITMWNGNSSRMGQKNTIGIILNHEDMPFTKDGIVPDIILNPHCIPTRCTMGQILESVLGKIGAIQGHTIDASTFNNMDVNNFPKILKKYGFEESGDEELRSGHTGKMLSSKIFIGPAYYQRLKHMVEDKIHAKSADGPVSLLTREPPKGRAQNGGLRIGEMERDCIIAHGTSLFLKEKFIDLVDKYTCKICDKCGIIAHKKYNINYYICPLCNESKSISTINTSYNFKLLIQELMSIGIKSKLILDQTSHNYGI